MKSPFPGMDPYLEQRWSDVHVKLLGFIGEALQPLLPRALRARSEERVLLEDAEVELRRYRSDVAAISTQAHGTGGIATVEPVVIEFPPRPPFDRLVQIIDVTNGNRVVTAIEVLSPWNKRPGRLNEDYCNKLEDYAAAEVNVVEIDLLRSSRGYLEVGQEDMPVEKRTPYLTAVRRARRPNQWTLYPMPLRQPLPRIPIPLRRTDPEVGLELQPLIDRVYIAGGHDDIDYTKPAKPPLSPDDAAWAAELVKVSRA
jgi:hypothetical protein